MVAAVRRMKGKKNENETKNSNINSKKIRNPDVKYVSAYFNTVSDENVIVIPKWKLNENKVETSTNVKYVSGYFDYSRISSEDVIVIPPKKKKNENETVKPLKSLKPELRCDAYKRKTPNNTWKPPKSTMFGCKSLLQDDHVYENKVETSTNVKYVSGYFDYSRISSEDVIVIPPKKKKHENEIEIETETVKPLKSLKSLKPELRGDAKKKKKNENEIETETVKPLKSLKSLKPELRSDAYKKKTPNNTWKPPKSTMVRNTALLQEDHVHDPWKVLIISILLTKTTGDQVKRVLEDLFKLCPDAKSCTQVAVEEIEQVIRSLGLQNVRPKTIKHLSQQYLYGSWTHVTQLHGVGKYVGDAYVIFCTGEWRNVTPTDKELLPYWNFLWTLEL